MQAAGLLDELHPDPDRAAQSFTAKRTHLVFAPPAHDDETGGQGEQGIQPEHPGAASAGNDGASAQRPDDARCIHGHPIERQRRWQLIAWYEFRDDGCKNRPSHGQTDAVGKRQYQQ